MMENKSKLHYLVTAAILYLAIPMLYMIFGNFEQRTILKELLSLITVAAFYLLLGQFYLSRVNIVNIKGHKYSKVVKLHKIIGYIAIPIIILHPIFIVLPRYLEASLDLTDAFILMVTNFESRGIILGLIALFLLLVIAITSMLRKKMKLKYTTWRKLHGLLSLSFICVATFHAVDLGRHMDTFLSTYTIVMASIGIVFLIRLYFFNQTSKEK